MGVNRARLVATDLDGTIVRSDGSVSARTVAALAAVERAGGHIVLVTGRPPRWMGPIAEAVGRRGVALCANGAMVYDLRDERVIATRMIDVETLAEAVGRLRPVLPGAGLAVEYADGMVAEAAYDLSGWDSVDTVLRVVEAGELVARPCAKLLVRDCELAADDLLKVVRGVLDGLLTPTHSSGNRLVEISALGVDKATALAAFCAERGIAAEEVVAFGDMPNDLPMLSWAGEAYAVANAHPEVLAAVPNHTAANDDDGVARVIERIFETYPQARK